jgi:hypothetical protein
VARAGVRHKLGSCSLAAVRGVAALLAGCTLGLIAPAAPALGSAAVQPPLPASEYSVRPVCAAPPAPGTASCLALQLVPVSAAARARTHLLAAPAAAPSQLTQSGRSAGPAAEGLYGLRPADLHSAYDLPESTDAAPGQTIGIVDAYDDPHAEADLAVFDQEFDLPPCTSANGCFKKVGEEAGSSLPAAEGEWAREIALDVEIAHAVCTECRIVLVEATSPAYVDLEAAERRAVSLGAGEISNSWGGEEPTIDSQAYNHPGVAITAASGDNGYRNWDDPGAAAYTDYPASSPHVVAVGGTRLALNASGAWASEQVWNGQGATGGGCSERFAAPSWQRALVDWPSVGCESTRAVADVAADADPYTGVAVYDSTPMSAGGSAPGWLTLGGTSLASPIVAATFALAGGVHSASGYAAQGLYERALAEPTAMRTIDSGSNGRCGKPFTFEGLSGCTALEEGASCGQSAICLARNGYSGPDGLGTPEGICAFQPAHACGPAGEGGVEPTGTGGGPAGTPGTPALGAPGSGEGSGLTAPLAAEGSELSASSVQQSTSGSPSAGPTRVSRLRLSVAARNALRAAGGRVPISDIAFSYLLSRADRVRIALARLTSEDGREHWRRVAAAFTVDAHAGQNLARLRGSTLLPPGRYRITLVPSAGQGRSLSLTLR